MSTRTWDPPGPGAWELERTHFSRPATAFAQESFREGFIRGFQHGTARYGLLLDHLEPAYVNRFGYMQPSPFGAPPGADGPPPKPVLWLLVRLHPKMRARIREGAKARKELRWRSDLAEWDTVDRPAMIKKHLAIQAVDVTQLSDVELCDHVLLVETHLKESHWMHHKYSVPAILIVGDFVAGATEWTGLPAGELLGLLRGSSDISHGFAADELRTAAEAIRASDTAQGLLDVVGNDEQMLADLGADPAAGGAVSAYLNAVRYRCVGYDVGEKCAGELPGLLVDTLRAATKGASAGPADNDAEATIRALVPVEHRTEFDARLAEARLMYRLRDERGVFADGWATGLARRALMEVGRRLAESGRVLDAEHAVELSASEAVGLLGGGEMPSATELADRFTYRESHTIDDAPPFLGGEPGGPPDPSILPGEARRWARANDAALGNLFGVTDAENTDEILIGTPVNAGIYEGTARLVHSAQDFGRIQRGDILVTRNTSPYFNVVLPLLGAIVTDRGGQLSHAAIVAREYGIPGIVGTREATAKIIDGSRVRVDGSTGEVHLLG